VLRLAILRPLAYIYWEGKVIFIRHTTSRVRTVHGWTSTTAMSTDISVRSWSFYSSPRAFFSSNQHSDQHSLPAIQPYHTTITSRTRTISTGTLLSNELQQLTLKQLQDTVAEPRLSAPHPPISFEEASRYRLTRSGLPDISSLSIANPNNRVHDLTYNSQPLWASQP
jgi:hypothetical protein